MQPIHKTGLVCPDCKQPFAMIVNILNGMLVLQCQACGNRWTRDGMTVAVPADQHDQSDQQRDVVNKTRDEG
jgi:ribosomal protein L37AE/L43A